MSQTLPHPTSNQLQRHFFAIICWSSLVLLLWVIVWRIFAFNFFVYDDTFIVLRYAKNFLDHGQLAWNLGEAVEGYTNPLHLVLITFLGACGIDLLDAARIINGLSYLGFAVVLFMVVRRYSGMAAMVLVAGLALADPAIIAWVWGGMEVPLTIVLLAMAQGIMLIAAIDPQKRNHRTAILSAVFFGLAFFNRPDNALYAVPAAFLWLWWRDRQAFLKFGFVFGGMVLAHTLVRLFFYGDVVPNTFYAKVIGTPAVTWANGWHYVWEGVSTAPYYYAAGFAALGALLVFRKTLRAFAVYALASIALGAIYVMGIGGDFMPGHRFIMPWLPLCLFALGLMLENVKPALRYGGLILCLLVMKSLFVLPTDLHEMDGTAIVGRMVGQHIQKTWPHGATVALNAAGAIPYYNMDKTFIDMLGLNDKHIAHRTMPDFKIDWQHRPGHGKGDGAYVLSREPDYIILSSVVGDSRQNTPVLPSDVEIRASADFKRCYKSEQDTVDWPPALVKQKIVLEENFQFGYYRRTCAKTAAN